MSYPTVEVTHMTDMDSRGAFIARHGQGRAFPLVCDVLARGAYSGTLPSGSPEITGYDRDDVYFALRRRAHADKYHGEE